MDLSLATNFIISVGAYITSVRIIPTFREKLIKSNLIGHDLCKKDKTKVPESLGVVTACVFLVAMFFFIPVPFSFFLNGKDDFSQEEFVELIVALLSICCMILLGFADDVLDLRWRHKVLLPTIATLPLLMVYYVNYNSTTILVPKFARSFLGLTVDIGVLYYVYMGMLAVFCTNAINILAGINGLEVGQAIIIAASIIVFNFTELILGNQVKAHRFSLYLISPFLATSLALWKYNKYPAKIFVGDTFCYFAGMTFAVVGILGHFSKTLLLFFIPQIINFLYSVPQLFHFIPCPRHRLPQYDSKTDLLHTSTTTFQKDKIGRFGFLFVTLFRKLKFISWTEKPDGTVITNNFTLINLVLVIFGPVHESIVTHMLLGIQVASTLIAFIIRYPLASYFYNK
ncbi:UDP-N-acetylglucosamine--dolichyl-phosphate N-acetylglucosaminephosphotransferase [Episyrphus balteatus]|uniref:UDP-N-acetylglucosamine--dolichyl-phosphate N-acetylglucosaminephosphotransferase n=1 Tax=Episyrphus balteatus TaxID=286459 RepID=UPI002486C9A3|nr:UDP-N-acetylglucosamine--dolichyl-phosphate N-acetylglucosaminephosphotransferase [Episyrphus balteatus]